MTKGQISSQKQFQFENLTERAVKGIDLDRAYQTLIRAYVDASIANNQPVKPYKNERLNERTLRKEQVT